MKKTFIFSAAALIVLSVFPSSIALAQSQQVQLPLAGLTPESPFYFLDRLSENLREFFTFNPEAKAKLQIEFAGERIAEIKAMVEEKGVSAKGLITAESLLQANVAHAADIVNKEKASGKDVTVFAKTLNDEFDAREQLLDQTFKDAKAQLKAQRSEIKTNLLVEARRTGNTEQITALEGRLNDINQNIDVLGQKKDQLKDSLQGEQKNIEKEMSESDQKKEEIRQKKEQEAIEAEEAEEAEEAVESEEPKEADEPKEAEKQQEVNKNDSEKDNSQNSDSLNKGDQNTTKTEDNE